MEHNEIIDHKQVFYFHISGVIGKFIIQILKSIFISIFH